MFINCIGSLYERFSDLKIKKNAICLNTFRYIIEYSLKSRFIYFSTTLLTEADKWLFWAIECERTNHISVSMKKHMLDITPFRTLNLNSHNPSHKLTTR